MEGKRAKKHHKCSLVVSGNAWTCYMFMHVQHLLNRLCKSSALVRSMDMLLDFGFFFEEYALENSQENPKNIHEQALESRRWFCPGFSPFGVKAELQFHSCWLSRRTIQGILGSLQASTTGLRKQLNAMHYQPSDLAFEHPGWTHWWNLSQLMSHFRRCQDRQKTRQR